MREVLRCASNHVEILPHFWHRVPLRGLPSLTSRRRAPRYASGGAPRRGRTWMVPARRADGVQALDDGISMPSPLGAPPQLVLGEFLTKPSASFARLRLKGPLWPAVRVRMLYFQQVLQRAASRHIAEPAGKPSERAPPAGPG